MKEVPLKNASILHSGLNSTFLSQQNDDKKKKRPWQISSAFTSRFIGYGSSIYNSYDYFEDDLHLNQPFFTEEAHKKMELKRIPNFEELSRSLSEILTTTDKNISAIQFLSALRQFSLTDHEEISNFLENPEAKHVLAQNEKIKMILIRWEPGDMSNIHGHAIGGCIFKVLYGQIEEKRYSAESEERLLSENTYYTDHIAYIDDVMGLHIVGNPNPIPAITLHLYTPGNYKAKK